MNPADVILPREIADLVADEIASGERIAWVGQPIPSRYARRGLGTALFGIPFTAFAFFWIAGASGFKMPDFSHGFGFFPLFGIPFVLVGLGMLSSPLWMLLKATRTAYVITDRRALTVERRLWQGVSVRSFEPECLTDLSRTQYPDGSGNLVFRRDYHASNRGRPFHRHRLPGDSGCQRGRGPNSGARPKGQEPGFLAAHPRITPVRYSCLPWRS